MIQIQGLVRKIWAANLKGYVENLNYPPDQHLRNKITFTNLGGLSIWFWDGEEIFHSDPQEKAAEIAGLMVTRSVINLSSDVDQLLVTTTSRIINAIADKNGEYEPLRKQLRRRMNPPHPDGYDPLDVRLINLHRNDEVWLFPAHQLITVGQREVPDDSIF